MKTAFISGASRGIGRAIAYALGKEGYHLAICCEKSRELLEETANDLEKHYHTQVLTYTGNIGDAAFVSEMGLDIIQHWGHMDIVVNNAGIAHIGLITEMDTAQWNHMMDVNLSSCFYTTKAFVPEMIQQKSGHIINISSMWGTCGASCEVAYSAAKGGMNAFTRALAKELAPSHIRVNAITCGVIDTQMNQMLSVDEKSELIEEIPWGRFGTPEDVALAVTSLIHSPSYLTGQIIGLDGAYL